ncbi:unnamed protein product [Allacma fusca]|uniref:Uncharacterized protein n=1 Tax=Allacma fusca TaxID=39272 RepID=A0A8J2LLC1_9HEXA|nr:unnamed protein product [Allacma fusca]
MAIPIKYKILASILSIILAQCNSKSIPSNCQDLEVRIVNENPSKSLKGQKFYYESDNSGYSSGLTGGQFSILMTGPQPIQWGYEGPGQELTLVESSKTERGCYVIELVRPAGAMLKATDTGRYVAKYVSNPEVTRSVYLYVPNKYPPFLLNTETLQTASWTEGKALVLPCLLNDPTMKVAFSKRSGLNEWKEVQNVGTYSPQTGFTIRKPFGSFNSLYGSYKCFTKLHNRNDTVFITVGPEEISY